MDRTAQVAAARRGAKIKRKAQKAVKNETWKRNPAKSTR
jgi:hypothetical protein